MDLTIELPAPRPRRDPLFQEYRERLLTALGVSEDPPPAAAPPAGTTTPAPAAEPTDRHRPRLREEKTPYVPQD